VIESARKLGAVWERLWFAPGSTLHVSAFRVLLGSYLLIYFLTFAPDVTLMFSNEGVYFPWRVPDYAPPPLVAWVIYVVTLLSMGALTLGLRTQVTAPLTLVLFLHHYFLQMAVKHSTFERLIIEWLLLLCFVVPRNGGQDAASSVHGSAQAAGWTTRLIRFQTVMLYLGAGLWKAANPHWRSGVLLKATLQGMWSTDAGFWLVRTVETDAGFALLSQSVIVGEILVGVLFCLPRAYPLAIAGGVIFHLSNVVFLAIPEFVVCIAPYVFFVDAATLQRWFERVRTSLVSLIRVTLLRCGLR